MEDELRPLPKGWVRTFDPETLHQFFVDTTKDPPRSIWTHPYDDNEYLSTLTSEERERIEEQSLRHGQPSKADIMAEHTDEEHDDIPSPSTHVGANDPPLPPRDDKGKGKAPLGRRLKDKLTGTTHEQREKERAKRAEEERQYYEQHMKFRAAMTKAAQTGQPQFVGKDNNGKDIYVEPPAYNSGYGYPGGYGYSPYNTGMYSTPNANYIRPQGPYQRPYGRGFGGGYGLPLAVGGGLLGGLLLTDMMF